MVCCSPNGFPVDPCHAGHHGSPQLANRVGSRSACVVRNASSRKVSGPFSRSAKGQRTGPAGMQGMRYDMAGAAAALAAVAALARCGITDGVRAVFPLVENPPDQGAVKPGDVVRAYDGTRIRIIDTDFEGRVVLFDALALAGAPKPRAIVSVAALTHQAAVALGAEVAAVLSRDAVLGRGGCLPSLCARGIRSGRSRGVSATAAR